MKKSRPLLFIALCIFLSCILFAGMLLLRAVRPAQSYFISYGSGKNAGIRLAEIGENETPDAGMWQAACLDSSSLYTGRYTSLALDKDGLASIAYYDEANGDLKFIRCSSSDCSVRNQPVVLDSEGDVGSYASLALDKDGLASIAYYDEANGDLKFIRCSSSDCSVRNQPVVLDSEGDVGSYASLSLDKDGLARITYVSEDRALRQYALKFISCKDTDCVYSDKPVVLEGSDQKIGRYNSLVLSAGNLPTVAYYDEAVKGLKFITCLDEECADLSTPALIDDSGDFAGQYISMVNGADGYPCMSYQQCNSVGYYAGCEDGSLKYMACLSSDCSSRGQAVSVESAKDPFIGRHSSLSIDSKGRSRVSYYSAEGLKFAYPVFSPVPAGAYIEKADITYNQYPDAGVGGKTKNGGRSVRDDFSWKVPDKDIGFIFLITIDTLRADHLGFMGYPRNTTPFLDSLVKESFIFKKAYTVASATFPSLASIFTSLHPLQHGILGSSPFSVLPNSVMTLAEYLKAEGYITAAFGTGAKIIKNHNFEQGFDNFYYLDPDKEPQDAATMVGKITSWLDKQQEGKKIFIWTHFIDSHMFWFHHAPDFQESGPGVSAGNEGLTAFWTEKQNINPEIYSFRENFPQDSEGRSNTTYDNLELGAEKEGIQRMRKIMEKYDGAIQHVDKNIAALYSFISKRGFNKNAIWIIVADHGVSMGDHSVFGHIKPYNEALLTPIIFHRTLYRDGRDINDAVVQNVDILPTVAELLGFELIKEPFQPQGNSLVPLISGKGGRPRPPVFSISWDGGVCSLIDGDYKYIHLNPARIEHNEPGLEDDPLLGDALYDLRHDPAEKNNLIDRSDLSEKKDMLMEKISRLMENFKRQR